MANQDTAPTGEPVQWADILRRAEVLARQIRQRPATDVAMEFPLCEIPWCSAFAAKFRNVLTPQECAAIIQLSEDAGYEQALVNIGGGRQKLMEDYRNSHRVMIDTPALAAAVFDRIRQRLNQALHAGGQLQQHRVGAPLEFNERLRFLRYTGGEFFEQHMDGCYVRPRRHPKAGDRSFLTVLLYVLELVCRVHACTELDGLIECVWLGDEPRKTAKFVIAKCFPDARTRDAPCHVVGT